MKKGIQYSHYCGTELQDLCSSIRLSVKLIDTDIENSKEWANHALKVVKDLAKKISQLDEINNMDY